MQRTTPEITFKIKDLPCAAFLVASGLRICDVEREGRACYFIFKDREKALELCKGFWSGNATVNAKAIMEAQRSLKDLVFSIPI